MTCAEHALENAIEAMKKGKEREEWAKTDTNLSSLTATPEEIWDMAGYIIYSYRSHYYGEDEWRAGSEDSILRYLASKYDISRPIE